MQCNSTRLTTGTLLNFLGFIKNYPACRPAACKKFQQSQLWLAVYNMAEVLSSLNGGRFLEVLPARKKMI